jgi:deoxyribonuclease-4
MSLSSVKLGFHVSIYGSIDQSFDRATHLGCTAFQIFTKNPRTWKSKNLTPIEIKAFRRKQRSSGISFIASHMSYLPNLASPDQTIYKKSIKALIEETIRCNELGIKYLVIHPGSHLKIGTQNGKNRLVQALSIVIEESGPMILIENSSGAGDQIGSKFGDISDIINEISSKRLGFCLDTCHAFAAGYDLATIQGLKKTLREFRETIGFNKLRLIHLNDSIGSLGSSMDHHEHIGLGQIGKDGFNNILKSQLSKRPMIMETPIDKRRDDVENMNLIRELAELKKK